MSRDSSRTYIHLHSPHHADLFEDFTSPSNTTNSSAATLTTSTPAFSAPTIPFTTSTSPPHLLAPAPLGNNPTPTHTSSTNASAVASFSAAAFPPEDILIPLHLLPPNPEDEDDIVPDQHAAFGITRALGRGQTQGGERWRDFESLEERVRGLELRDGVNGSGAGGARGGLGAEVVGRTPTSRAREGRR